MRWFAFSCVVDGDSVIGGVVGDDTVGAIGGGRNDEDGGNGAVGVGGRGDGGFVVDSNDGGGVDVVGDVVGVSDGRGAEVGGADMGGAVVASGVVLPCESSRDPAAHAWSPAVSSVISSLSSLVGASGVMDVCVRGL